MNLQQLEYIVAIDTYRRFALAAEHSHVTQPTLSMMVQKLEEELGVKIFDRSKQPVVPTQAGKKIIEQARVVLKEVAQLRQLSKSDENELSGELRIGIIPTLAPYLLPHVLPSFLKHYPKLKVVIQEKTTEQIVDLLQKELLDVGIMATPLKNETLKETFLFNEAYLAYAAKGEVDKAYILPKDIDSNKLWILEEGHCMRSQMMNICKLKKNTHQLANLSYETGSIESLIKMVDVNGGITLLPELAVNGLSKKAQQQVVPFQQPVPVRTISLVTYRHFVKQRLFEAIKQDVIKSVAPLLNEKQKVKVVGITKRSSA